MTLSALESMINTLLASGQPDKIIAVKHRQTEKALAETIWDIQERADAFKDLDELISYTSGTKIIVIKDGTGYLIDASLLPGGGSGSVAGTWVMKGAWDASTDVVPSNGDSTVKQGYTYENGNFSSSSLLGPDSDIIHPYAMIRALVDNPGPLLSDPSKWRLTYGII